MVLCDHDQRHRPDASLHHRADTGRALADRAFHSIDVGPEGEHPMTAAAWEAFVVNWLFWSGIAIGAVVFSGLLVLTDAEWTGELGGIAERFGRFLPLSLVALALLLLHDPRRYARSAVVAAASYAVALWFCRTP